MGYFCKFLCLGLPGVASLRAQFGYSWYHITLFVNKIQVVVSWFSKQNSSWYCRQAFIQAATGLQVWGKRWLTAPYIGSKRFYSHAQMSEHSQYILLFYVHAYWLEWTEHAHWRMFCVHVHYHTNSKLRGVEWNSVPYMIKFILAHIPVECGVVLRIKIRPSKSLFPQIWWGPSAVWMKACLQYQLKLC